MAVKIEDIEVYCLQDDSTDFVRFEGSYQNLVVVVRGDNGLYGVGETDSHPQVVREIIKSKPYNYLASDLTSLLIGQRLDNPQRLWQLMYDKTRWYGRHGVVLHAISAVDIALWDLYAKTRQVPLVELIGGLKHQSLPAYATIYPMFSETVALKAQLQDVLDQGFKALKICVEPWWESWELVVENLNLVRASVGDDVSLMLDVAAEYDRFDQLSPFLKTLEELNFEWIEAPFDLNNLEDHCKLSKLTDIALGVGDLGMTTCREFEPYLKANALDIAQPDITMFGGVSETLKLLALLARYQKRFIPHGYNTDITLATNLHVMSAQAKPEPVEYSTSPSVLRSKLVKNPTKVDCNGQLSLDNSQVGLGIEIDWDIIGACKIP